MRHHLCSALVLALATATITPASARDARLVTRPYNPDEVVVVKAREGVQATISFSDDENIENVAIGDSNSWEITPNKRANLLFIKPIIINRNTNMTVVTNRRTYLFDLVSQNNGPPIYFMRFSYLKDEQTTSKAEGGMTPEEASAAAHPPSDDTNIDPSKLNFAWQSRGNTRLHPIRIYDDGTSTYLAWDVHRPVPAILTRNERGEEGAVNYSVRGTVIVLDQVPDKIVLRVGREMAELLKQRKVALTTPSQEPAATPPPAVPEPAATPNKAP